MAKSHSTNGMSAITLALGLMICGGALAQQAQNTNYRGTLAGFDGKVLSVKTRDGKDVQIDLPETVNVNTTKPFTMADITPGMMLAVTTVKRPNGTIVAIDVRPIPPTASAGLSNYDLQPDSTMTNASLEGSAQTTDGHELTLNYKTGTVKVLVPPGTPMSQSTPGSRADLKPGEAIFVPAHFDNGRLVAARVQVSKDGVKPTQ